MADSESDISTPQETVRKALAAFRAITGKGPEDAPDECSVFVKAALAATHPDDERTKWIRDVRGLDFTDPRFRQLRMVEDVRRRAQNGRGTKGWKEELLRDPEILRRILEPFDARFLRLSDEEIQEALSRPKSQTETVLAELMIACGAFDHGIQKTESNVKARKRVANYLSKYGSKFDPW